MAIRTSEASFEEIIARTLVSQNGYRLAPSTEYQADLCLLPADVMTFIHATQPQQWKAYQQQYPQQTEEAFLARLAEEIGKRGTLSVLRTGIKDRGVKFTLAYFTPVTGLNSDSQRLYGANQFSVMRQLFFEVDSYKSIDLGIFLNGIPIFTAELKNHFTGQSVQNGIKQYRDRNAKHPLFKLGRCLAHFALDSGLVYMTTHVNGEDTRFLPFNQGYMGGAGNPPQSIEVDRFATAYLWEQIWHKNSVLDLIENFIVEGDVLDEDGNPTNRKQVIFPRYHQLDTVRRLLAAARQEGTGKRYLIQHSAGSGKSNTIAWLAFQLISLHTAQDQRVFDGVIIVTDRRILDKQLQDTMRLFEQVKGTLENIDQTSRQLKTALENGKQVIVTTLQKFPVILNDIVTMPARRFALIVDEAHSSQSGKSRQHMNQILRAGSLEEAAQLEADEGEEDEITTQALARQQPPNVSTFAFTATPKRTTLELFGRPNAQGDYTPFSVYSMRQAIQEGFILDVLANYTTYRAFYHIQQAIADDPQYDRQKAQRLLRGFVELHEHTIDLKTQLMVNHFHDYVVQQVKGKAKAMLVTRSRLHAVRYKRAFDRYLQAQGLPYQALVAFTGKVEDGGLEYTEAQMNGFSDAQTAKTFRQPAYRFLIVAEKFQTGFDQPLLYTMYVDKVLGGVRAVQTLSRLNRTHPDKDSTFVLDFANDAEAIQSAFQDFYETTLLSTGTDPNLLYDYERQLEEFGIYYPNEINLFIATWTKPQKPTQAALHSLMEPIVERYSATSLDTQADFRGELRDYLRLYDFLAQIIPFTDTGLEKLYLFGKLLLTKLPIPREELPYEIQQAVNLDSYRLQQTHQGKIELERGQGGELTPQTGLTQYAAQQEEKESLSAIIAEFNARFGTNLGEAVENTIEYMQHNLLDNPALETSMQVNTLENARLTFESVLSDMLLKTVQSNFDFYQQLNADQGLNKAFRNWLFEWYQKHRVA